MKSATLSSNRVIALLETYGGNPRAWPKAERLAAEQSIAQSEQLQTLQQQTQQFDRAVSGLFLEQQAKVTDSELKAIKQRIINQLPQQQVLEKKSTIPYSFSFFWQRFVNTDYQVPALLGCIALLLSITLFSKQPELVNTNLSYAEYQALILESYADAEESNQQTNELQMLAFLEPELVED